MAARWSPPKQARVAMVTLPEAPRGRTQTDVLVEKSLKKLQTADGAQITEVFTLLQAFNQYIFVV